MEQRAFAEQIVRKQKNGKVYLMQAGIGILAVLCLVIVALIPALMMFVPILIVMIILLAVLLIRRMNIEYEYILTDHLLDVDTIRAKSSRKRLFSVDVKNFDRLAAVEGEEELKHLRSKAQTVYDVASSARASGRWFAEFGSGGETGRTLLIFEPNERMLKALMLAVSPRKVRKPQNGGEV